MKLLPVKTVITLLIVLSGACFGYLSIHFFKGSSVTDFVQSGGYKNHDGTIWYFNKQVYGADPKTFKGLEYDYAIDGQDVYLAGRSIASADADSFTVLGHIMARDKEHVYVFDRIASLVPSTNELEYIGNFYTKHNGTLFFKDRIVTTPVDFETLEVVGQDYTLKDSLGFIVNGSRN